MAPITAEIITQGVRMWAQATGAFTGSGRPDVGDVLDTHNVKIQNVARRLCDTIAAAVEEAGAREVWCDDQGQGYLALSDRLGRSSSAALLPEQLEELRALIAGNETYETTFMPFIDEVSRLLKPESESHKRLLHQICLENV